jgi:hypothetical protein
MWTLIMLVVNIHDPTDVPGRMKLFFPTEQECVHASASLTYTVKFDWFKVTSECKKES